MMSLPVCEKFSFQMDNSHPSEQKQESIYMDKNQNYLNHKFRKQANVDCFFKGIVQMWDVQAKILPAADKPKFLWVTSAQ